MARLQPPLPYGLTAADISELGREATQKLKFFDYNGPDDTTMQVVWSNMLAIGSFFDRLGSFTMPTELNSLGRLHALIICITLDDYVAILATRDGSAGAGEALSRAMSSSVLSSKARQDLPVMLRHGARYKSLMTTLTPGVIAILGQDLPEGHWNKVCPKKMEKVGFAGAVREHLHAIGLVELGSGYNAMVTSLLQLASSVLW